MVLQKQKIFLAGLMLSLGLLSFSVPYTVQARGLVPCGGYKADNTPEPACKFTDIFALFARVTNWLIGVGGLFAVYNLISAGFWLVWSQGNEESIATQKKAITNAIVGFALILIAYMIVNTAINYILVGGKPGYRLDLTNPTCYLSPTTQNQCFVTKTPAKP